MSLDIGIQQGRITLIVHRAESLVALNSDGASNPFVMATIGQDSKMTSVMSGTTNPSFETTFTFTACPLPTILTLRVYNRSLFSEAEELLGSATLTLFSASPMIRRNVQLGHGGNVSLSQKARDGCGSLDISYEVIMMTPSETAAQSQSCLDDKNVPVFLRDESGPMDFKSMYTAAPVTQELSLPPRPSPPQMIDPPAFSETCTVPQQIQPPTQQPMFDQPPQFLPMSSSVTPPPSSVAPPPLPPPSVTLPPPPSVTPSPSVIPPPQPSPLSSSKLEPYAVPVADALHGTVMRSPNSKNFNELTTLQSGQLAPSPPPPPPSVLPLQKLPTTPSLSVARGVESPKAPNLIGAQYLSAANAPVVPAEESLLVVHPSIHGTSSVGEGVSVQQAVSTTDMMTERDALRQLPSPPIQTTSRPTAMASPPSLSSNVTLSSTSTPPFNATSKVNQHKQQEQQYQLANSEPPPATSNITVSPSVTAHQPPSHSAFIAPAEKNGEKTTKKVTVVTTAKDRSASANAVKVAVKAAPLHDRVPRYAVASPMRENRRSLVGNATRSNSRGRISTTTAASGNAHHSSTLYQRADELLAAAAAGDIAIFQKLRGEDPLLSHGFENVRDYSGRTILHLAAWHGHVDILKTLLQASPSLPMVELRALRSHSGNTILHSAAEGGRVDVVQWLRFGHPATGALVGLRNVRGFTATDCAREAGFMEIFTMLNES